MNDIRIRAMVPITVLGSVLQVYLDTAPSTDVDTTFGVDFFSPDITLIDALNLGGGGNNALARHAVAGLLSAAHPGVDYDYTVAEVIAFVQAGDTRLELLGETRPDSEISGFSYGIRCRSATP